MATKKVTTKKTTKKAAARAAAKGATAGKRKVNPALMKPLRPSPELAKVVGSKALPRGQVTKKLWEYIKSNGLQDGRTINADDTLRVLFAGKKSVTMFEMPGLINKHLG